MSELVLSIALDALTRLVLGREVPPPAEVAQSLRVLQRLGMTRPELMVHVERLRATNDARDDLEQVEENALLALEIIAGSTRLGLEWSASETAAAWLPRALSRANLDSGAHAALAPSDLLPARPPIDGDNDIAVSMARRQWVELSKLTYTPKIAEFFRSPKTGLTSRPAALLAPQDRLVYEALAEVVAPRMSASSPSHVIWPRDRSPQGVYSDFAEAPRSWDIEFVVRTDIASYYESIDHAFLAVVIAETFEVGGAFALAIEAFLDTVMGSTVGLPQGPAASDILASAYLADIDLELARLGWPVVRYSDDMLIGADSVAEARSRIRDLETLLRERGLQLSNEKTRVIRAKTYTRMLEEPTEKLAFRRIVQQDVQDWLETHPQLDEDQVLCGVGIPEESLWDLLYHGSITLTEALKQVKDRLLPPWIDAYERVFSTEAWRLRGGGYPGDGGGLSASELRECLLFMTAGAKPTSLEPVDSVLNWHPTLVRDISRFLAALGDAEPEPVASFLASRATANRDSDLELAWLLDATVQEPRIAATMADVLNNVADSSNRPLSRATAVRALATVNQLTSDRWRDVLIASSPALRAELLLAREADPSIYPDNPVVSP